MEGQHAAPRDPGQSHLGFGWRASLPSLGRSPPPCILPTCLVTGQCDIISLTSLTVRS